MFLDLTSLKVDFDAFLRSLGLDPETVKSPDIYIPIETCLFIQDEAADYVSDPYLGLHMGEFAEAGAAIRYECASVSSEVVQVQNPAAVEAQTSKSTYHFLPAAE